jgi:predicted DNA-binding WGR domain protein
MIFAEQYELFKTRIVTKVLGEYASSKQLDQALLNVSNARVKHWALYYTNPSENSDKVYEVDIVRAGPDPKSKNTFHVLYGFGKRGKTLKISHKTQKPVSLKDAEMIAQKLLDDKMKGGYTTNVSGKPFSK